MDARELRLIIDGLVKELPKRLLDDQAFEKFVFTITKIGSYLESEQEKRINLGKAIKEHQLLMEKNTQSMGEFDKLIWGDKQDIEKYPGIAHDWAEGRKQSQRNQKLIIICLGTLIPILIIAIMQLLGFHIKP